MKRKLGLLVAATTASASLLGPVLHADASAQGPTRVCKGFDYVKAKGMTCKQAKRFLNGTSTEPGAVAKAVDNVVREKYTFTYQGMRCRLPYEDPFFMTCASKETPRQKWVHYESD